jgi:hypothetical protein
MCGRAIKIKLKLMYKVTIFIKLFLLINSIFMILIDVRYQLKCCYFLGYYIIGRSFYGVNTNQSSLEIWGT